MDVARVIRGERLYDVALLSREIEIARNILEFDQGPYGNAISLPSADQLHESYRTHHNNLPFSGALAACPYFKSIFDSLQTEKAAFRLLRRVPHSAYAFHDDKDRGRDVVRFQIPINTSNDAFLLLARNGLDLARFDIDSSGFEGDQNGDVWFNMEQLYKACSDVVDLFYLEAGCVNYFDTDQVHTLINGANDERVTLSFDLVMNEWLESWMEANLTHALAPSPIEPSRSATWNWNALRHGIIHTD
jgi:hypothetical protein